MKTLARIRNILIATALVSLAIGNCTNKKEEDDASALLLLMAMDQNTHGCESGEANFVVRNATNTQNTYTFYSGLRVNSACNGTPMEPTLSVGANATSPQRCIAAGTYCVREQHTNSTFQFSVVGRKRYRITENPSDWQIQEL